jgi:hypothetical protein
VNTACKRAVFFYCDSGHDFLDGFDISKTNGNAVLKTDILIHTIEDIEESGHVSLER